ncbi:MAG: exo-beta-N-acetylmuramidase NamZ domain-containing protein [Armatimonadota bacterium]
MAIPPSSGVRPGIDILLRDNLRLLDGARCGLVTNHTGRTADGIPTVDVLHHGPGVRLEALFGPEHGIRGAVDAPVDDGRDDRTGLPVHSLYGPRTEPTDEQLAGLDTLVFDIQDIGCRFYTYLSTLGGVLTAAARKGLRVVVLDRPNPVGGVAVEGPLADSDRLSFTAFHPIPIRHGMTLGELARLVCLERGLKTELVVVKCEGWKRADHWDATGLLWVDPSPNMRSPTQALLYPGVALAEFTNVSVGRGTDTPFERFGAPWIEPRSFAAALNDAKLPGVRFVPIEFTPRASRFEGERCGGVYLTVLDRQRFQPVRTGLELAAVLRRHYRDRWQASKLLTLLAHRSTMDGLLADEPVDRLAKEWSPALKAFLELRKHVLLYD